MNRLITLIIGKNYIFQRAVSSWVFTYAITSYTIGRITNDMPVSVIMGMGVGSLVSICFAMPYNIFIVPILLGAPLLGYYHSKAIIKYA